MRSMLLLALMPLTACATDDAMPETSTDVLAMTVDDNCATGKELNAETTVVPLQYDFYYRPQGSTDDPLCRGETIVEFTVTNAPGPLGVQFHTSTTFGSDPFGGGNFTEAECHASRATTDIWEKTGPNLWKKIWGAAVTGTWDSSIRLCSRLIGDNSPAVGNGVYRVHGTGVIDGGPFSDMKIYSGTPPIQPPPH
jgi:hypothetical protein